MTPLPKSADAVVIGGGVVGCSIAYHLARDGMKVVVAEKSFIGAGTSTATFAWVGAHRKGPLHYHRFSLQGIAQCRRIAAELDTDIEFMQRGSLIFLSEADFEKATTEVPDLQREGYDLQLIDRETLFEMEPCAGEIAGSDAAGATFCPSDAEVNPLILLRAYARNARQLGAAICRNTTVEGILSAGGRIEGVTTDRGVVHAPVVINTAGPLAADVARWAGVEVPMAVTRGQILVTEKLPPILNYIHSGLRQSRSGNLIIGVTTENVGLDKRNSFDGIDHIARRVLGKMPLLRDVRILRAYAGLRPRPNDGHPVIDRSDTLDGFYVAVMQSGITLSALVGQLVCEWITTGQRPEDLHPYRLSRFDPQQ